MQPGHLYTMLHSIYGRKLMFVKLILIPSLSVLQQREHLQFNQVYSHICFYAEQGISTPSETSSKQKLPMAQRQLQNPPHLYFEGSVRGGDTAGLIEANCHFVCWLFCLPFLMTAECLHRSVGVILPLQSFGLYLGIKIAWVLDEIKLHPKYFSIVMLLH